MRSVCAAQCPFLDDASQSRCWSEHTSEPALDRCLQADPHLRSDGEKHLPHGARLLFDVACVKRRVCLQCAEAIHDRAIDSLECTFTGNGESGRLTWGGGECEAEACMATDGEGTDVTMD